MVSITLFFGWQVMEQLVEILRSGNFEDIKALVIFQHIFASFEYIHY